MVGQLHNFHQRVVRRRAAEGHALLAQNFLKGIVELIAMAMPFVHHILFVGFVGLGAGQYLAGIGTQTHGAPLITAGVAFFHIFGAEVEPFGHQVNNLVVGQGIELLGIGVVQTGHMAGKFNDSALHAQTDTEEGHVFFAGVADSRDLALHAAVTEAAGHQNAVTALEH